MGKKYYFLIVFIINILPINAISSTNAASSCSASDVTSAINASGAGDTVTIPGGNCSWSSTVTIGKPLTINGAGPDASGTTISTSGNGGFVVTTGINNVSIGSIRFTGANEPIVIGTVQWSSTGNRNYRVHNCYFSGYGVPLRIHGHSTGVIDNNTFASFSNQGDGINVEGDNAGTWNRATGLGTDDFTFFENNTVYTGTSRPNQVISAYQGGRMVVRWNRFIENSTGSWGGVIDVHGNGHGNDVRGGRAWEIYNNTFTKVNNNWVRAMHIRGGTGVIYNNTFTTSGSYSAWAVYTEFQYYRASANCSGGAITTPSPGYCDPAETAGYREGYPCTDQHGRGINISGTHPGPMVQASEHIYIWNNLYGATLKDAPLITSCTYNNTAIQAGRDYIIGQRPGYVPYTYPHPLVNDTPPPTKTPNAPSIIGVN